MAKLLSPSSIRRQATKKPKIKLGGVSADPSNKVIALASSLKRCYRKKADQSWCGA